MKQPDIKSVCPSSGDGQHLYKIVTDKANADVIRKLRGLNEGIPVWRCVHCGEVTESM